ncbi:2'-5' RNA ligase family protein [Actinoplanes sp. L3-i22]|uniref:2'-5' RNA ligase family protein n=1 Tax=Actinoplanes sp. L3-i22 TaxID=2836373 RepID=UPI001C77F420|nr:2'-5' RNA ligase family protein [Actinoplanes sp. L3-i22]BCY12130.1 hypothetical protein L3i22_072180 [Actinoplanes sp. L3-i22]
MRTVELLLDQEQDFAVRREWALLRDAGLPSLADHGHPTNRPHLTVVRAASLDGLPELTLPLVAELGPVRRLGRALVRPVTPTAELRDLHSRVWSALPGAWPPPGEWFPHVSLALRAPGDMLDRLPAEIGRPDSRECSFVAARSYDTEARTVTDIEA